MAQARIVQKLNTLTTMENRSTRWLGGIMNRVCIVGHCPKTRERVSKFFNDPDTDIWGIGNLHILMPGIEEHIKLRLFEPYFSTKKSGTGLGLAIAHTIVTEHNGTIRIRDNYPTGAVFIVELPLDS